MDVVGKLAEESISFRVFDLRLLDEDFEAIGGFAVLLCQTLTSRRTRNHLTNSLLITFNSIDLHPKQKETREENNQQHCKFCVECFEWLHLTLPDVV